MKEDLARLHSALLLIAAEIDRVCRKNDIGYSLTGGSLIGAVRHRGFIPWDDDMDLAMLRGEYERFLTACETDLDPRFELQTIRNDPVYPYGFGKVILKGTRIEMEGHEREAWQRGVFVDIFPMDNVPETKWRRKLHQGENYLWKKLLERKAGMKIGRGNRGKYLVFSLLGMISRLYSFRGLARRLEKTMRRYQNADTKQVCNLGGMYGYDRECTQAAYYRDLMDVPFEELRLKIIRSFDAYLTGVYGDYMTLPPENRRHTHRFALLELGDAEPGSARKQEEML